MKNREIRIFALLPDLEQILKFIENSEDIHYFKTGLFDNRDIQHYNSIFEISNLGMVQYGDWNWNDNYLAIPKGITVNIRDVPQRAGGTKFAVDQMINEKSIQISLGGIYKGKENILVAGSIATISEDEFSIKLYKLFSSKIKKEFNPIGAFYVGKLAEEKLKSGWRLVTNEKQREEFDLQLSS